MSNRKKVPDATQFEVAYSSGRRCCMCFALENDFDVKPGQIAHLDQDPANNSPANLAWLCLPHHDAYDSKTSQSKGFTEAEVRGYRELLFAKVSRWREERSAVAGGELMVSKLNLLDTNIGVFFFAALGASAPALRKLLLDDTHDRDVRSRLFEAWTYLDTEANVEPQALNRMQSMAQYVGRTEDGMQDLRVLIAIAAQALYFMTEVKRNDALFAIKNDTIRSALLLQHKIRTDKVASKRNDNNPDAG